LQRQLLDAAESFFAQSLQVESVDEAVNREQSLGLRRTGIEALRKEDHSDAGEVELLFDP
jgi:hypothetical protein